MKALALVITAWLGLMLSAASTAGIGDFDMSYGDGGLSLTTPFLILGDGRLLYAEPKGSYENSDPTRYSRTDVDGHSDPGFGVAGFRTLSITSFIAGTRLRTPDGKVIVGARQWAMRAGVAYWGAAIVRLDANGEPDASFGTGGIVSIPIADLKGGRLTSAESLAQQADGRILALVATYVSFYDAATTAEVRRFNVDGSVDTSFGRGTGRVEISVLTASSDYECCGSITVLPDGTIRVDGAKTDFFDPTGEPVSLQSGPALQAFAESWRVLGLLPGGDYLIAGAIAASNPGQYFVARVHAGGTIDKTFGADGTGYVRLSFSPDQANVSDDGAYLYVANQNWPGDAGHPPFVTIGRLLFGGPQAGRLDPNFGSGGLVSLYTGRGFALSDLAGESGGRVILSGSGKVLRLLGINSPGSGMFAFADISPSAYNDASTTSLQVFRAGGSSGTATVDYAIANPSTNGLEPASGQLVWADGDSSSKLIEIRFTKGSVTDPSGGSLKVELNTPTGGAGILTPTASLSIYPAVPLSPPAPTSPSTPAPTPNPVSPSSGGGGSLDALALALLAMLWWISVRRNAHSHRCNNTATP